MVGSFQFFLSVTLWNGSVCAKEFAVKTLEYRKRFCKIWGSRYLKGNTIVWSRWNLACKCTLWVYSCMLILLQHITGPLSCATFNPDWGIWVGTGSPKASQFGTNCIFWQFLALNVGSIYWSVWNLSCIHSCVPNLALVREDVATRALKFRISAKIVFFAPQCVVLQGIAQHTTCKICHGRWRVKLEIDMCRWLCCWCYVEWGSQRTVSSRVISHLFTHTCGILIS